MYIKDFITTYKSIDDYNLSFALYQVQLLQAFNIKSYDDNKILNEVKKLEIELYNNVSFLQTKNNLLENYKDNLIFNNDNIIMLFFSYDFFDQFHKCYIKNDFSKFNI